jgi:hypothetical protein
MTARALASVVIWALASAGVASAESCPRLPAGLICAPLPDEDGARREVLQALDVDGREAVTRGDYATAATAFGCLVESDPTPEAAGNLAVVLREQGALGDALLIARCAEQLAPPGPARERALTRRVDIERRLGLSPAATGLATGVATPLSAVPSPRVSRGWSYAGLAVGATVLIGAGVLYVMGRARADQFGDEQRINGYTARARDLHDEGRTLEITSWVGAGVGVAAAIAGGVLLTF